MTITPWLLDGTPYPPPGLELLVCPLSPLAQPDPEGSPRLAEWRERLLAAGCLFELAGEERRLLAPAAWLTDERALWLAGHEGELREMALATEE